MSAALARTAAREPEGTTDRLAAFVREPRVGGRALAKAASALLDTLAVTIAGSVEPGPRRLAASLTTAGDDGVALPWSKDRYREDDAARLIGMASHALDYDDVCMLAVCHPSAPILTALLAVPDRAGTSGRAFLEAFLVGTEVVVRLGQAMGFRHYALGFHATATLGTVGAAAALCRLRRLDDATTRNALAIAASLASGLRVNFGTHVKSLHVGIAAANGLTAARLAAAGLEGAAEAFDGDGYLRAFTGGEVTAWQPGIVLGRPFAIEEPGFEQKRYPCCYMLHKMVEATLRLRRETGLTLADVASVRVDVARGGTAALIHPYPTTGLEALFSAPYAVAASLADGRIDLSTFTGAAVRRPDVQRRLSDIQTVEDAKPARAGSDVGSAPVTVTLTPRVGTPVACTITASPGSAADPLTAEQLRAKWADCLRRAAPAIAQDALDGLLEEGQGALAMPSLEGWLGRLACAAAT